MPDQTIEERIISALEKNGPMNSEQLRAALDLEWTEFSVPLMSMIRTIFNPNGKVIRTRVGIGQTLYHLPDQTIN